jgi:hypothetical protein
MNIRRWEYFSKAVSQIRMAFAERTIREHVREHVGEEVLA